MVDPWAFLLRKNTQESQNRHLKKPDPAFLKWFSRIFSLLRKEFGEVSTPLEKDLMSLLPEKYWRDISLYLIFLGRKSCKAHRRFCEDCILKKDCPSSSIISGV
ncbi:hypothetical protein [Leptospira interrogans]|uniref:hypothetical protein n=1 Tax=Leptospira interrogans TaxID=173 RepID=UPI00403668A4